MWSTWNADVPDPSIGGAPNLTAALLRPEADGDDASGDGGGGGARTTPEGGAVTLVAALTRKPQPGASVVVAVSCSAPHAASVQPGPALLSFDDANWDVGTRVVVSGNIANGSSLSSSSARFDRPIAYSVDFRLVWTDDPFFLRAANFALDRRPRAAPPDGLLAAPSGRLGGGGE